LTLNFLDAISKKRGVMKKLKLFVLSLMSICFVFGLSACGFTNWCYVQIATETGETVSISQQRNSVYLTVKTAESIAQGGLFTDDFVYKLDVMTGSTETVDDEVFAVLIINNYHSVRITFGNCDAASAYETKYLYLNDVLLTANPVDENLFENYLVIAGDMNTFELK